MPFRPLTASNHPLLREATLLTALIDEDHRRSLPGVSLSVDDNPARRLDERAGLEVVGCSGGADKMRFVLRPTDIGSTWVALAQNGKSS